jgi:hypothetical protein
MTKAMCTARKPDWEKKTPLWLAWLNDPSEKPLLLKCPSCGTAGIKRAAGIETRCPKCGFTEKIPTFRERYYGEDSGRIVADWLNRHKQETDPIRRLLAADSEFHAGGFRPFEAARKIDSTLREVLCAARFAIAPVLVEATIDQWRLDWRPIHFKKRGPALAIQKFLDLASEGLLGHLRQCAWCKQWFFARFSHQRFDSNDCQLADFRSDPKWKKQRADYMRRRRRAEKRAVLRQNRRNG